MGGRAVSLFDNPDLRWKSYSGNPANECVEWAVVGSQVGVRDSKNPDGGNLVVSEPAWEGLLSFVRQNPA